MKKYKLVAKIEGKAKHDMILEWGELTGYETSKESSVLTVDENYRIARVETDSFVAYAHYKSKELTKVCVYKLEG